MKSIRIAKSDDHDDEIASLDLMCFTPDEAHPVEISAEAESWVALDGDSVVGYLVSYDKDGVYYVDRYGVASTHAGHGLGKRLLRAWLRWSVNRERWSNLCPSVGGSFAWTYTVANNARSINALTACGFRAWDCEVLPSGEPRDKRYCVWRKDFV